MVPNWYLRVKPQCLPDALALVSASTRSINLEFQPSKIQVFLLSNTLLKLGGLGVGSADQRHADASWRAWQTVPPTLMTATKSLDAEHPFCLYDTTPRPACATTNRTFTPNERPCFPPQTTGPGHPYQNHTQNACQIHSMTATPPPGDSRSHTLPPTTPLASPQLAPTKAQRG